MYVQRIDPVQGDPQLDVRVSQAAEAIIGLSLFIRSETWTLQELADELGVRKSTMHHHLSVLRSAGLLRLRFSEKRYSLRKAPLDELSHDLGEYLGSGGRRR